MAIATINPATGEFVTAFNELSKAEVETRVGTAYLAAQSWRKTSLSARTTVLQNAAEILDRDKDRWARLIVLEMGKNLRAAIAEVQKCAMACRHYAELSAVYLADQPLTTEPASSYVRHLPLGVVLAVMPWNFPFWQAFRFLAPAIAAGNVALLKHASNVPQCALAIEEIMKLAGAPKGVFQTLLISANAVAGVVADPRVSAITLTGSEAAGARVAEVAGRELKKCVLELGGSDPYIVMPSADLEKATHAAVQARITNNGQSCVAAKRFIIHSSIYDEFKANFVAAFEQLKIGDPLDPSTDVGPLATSDTLSTLEKQMEDFRASGAQILIGGARLKRPGNFFAPAVVSDISRESKIYREETFGPVALLFRARDINEAIEIANDSPYGLGSSVWTRDAQERGRFIDELETGQTFFNTIVASDPRLPFGGVKRSGYGRELGRHGMMEFVNAKTIVVND